MSVYVARPQKAGPVGPGAGVLQTEYLLPNVLTTNHQQRMAKAVGIGREVAYIRSAEMVISSKIADPLTGVSWHLEDPEEETIDDDYPDARAVEAYRLVDAPMEALRGSVSPIRTREEIWEITSRHMGLAGQGAWYLENLNTFGIPSAICYVRPDRLDPDYDGAQLARWYLDKGPGNRGTELSVEEVVLLQLQTPDDGIWAPGLVESALTKALLNGAIDRHFAQVLAGGGRLSGILAPRQGAIEDDSVFNQLQRDWRNVTEQPESARRLQVVRAPIDFTKTVQTPQEMALIDLMVKNRDDLLAIWRVPLSQVGGSTAAGLNSGDVRKYDEAALWQNAVTPRLSRFNAAIQAILDRFLPYLGWAPQIVFDIPEFDDDSPRFDKLQKSQFIPLTNDERRGLINMEPLADPAIGSAIVMPNTMVPYAQLGQQPPPSAGAVAMGEAPAEAEMPPTEAKAGKASFPDAMKELRTKVDQAIVPQMASSVDRVLSAQREDIAARVRGHWEAIVRKPRDTSLWWRAASGPGRPEPWDVALAAAIEPHMQAVSQRVSGHVRTALSALMGRPRRAKAVVADAAIQYVLTHGAGRVTNINRTTRDAIDAIIAQGIDEGWSAAEAGDAVAGWTGFDELRGETIARTETMFAYNTAALGTYDDMGVSEVEAIDGEDDEECADRNGQVFSVDEAADIEDHPNGTLDWVPIVPEEGDVEEKAQIAPPPGPDPVLVELQARFAAEQAERDAQREAALQAAAERAEREALLLEAIKLTHERVTAGLRDLAASLEQPPVIVNVTGRRVRKAVIRDSEGRIVGLEEVPDGADTATQ